MGLILETRAVGRLNISAHVFGAKNCYIVVVEKKWKPDRTENVNATSEFSLLTAWCDRLDFFFWGLLYSLFDVLENMR